MRDAVRHTLEGMRLGEVITHKNLSFFPIFEGPECPISMIGLSEALSKGFIEVTEVSESGSVPNLKVKNTGDVHVLILDGEELKGAKQNRIVNTSILVAPKTELEIPVSCTEQGRWNYNSRGFRSSENMLYAQSRSMKSRRVAFNLQMKQSYDADQGAIWDEVHHFQAFHSTSSRTKAMSDTYEQKQVDMDAIYSEIPCQEGQKGLLVLQNGEPVSMDFVPNAAIYAGVHQKLLASHVLSMRNKEEDAAKVDLRTQANNLLQTPHLSEEKSYKSVGVGEDLRYEASAAGGAALVVDETLVHLNLYSTEGLSKDGSQKRADTATNPFTEEQTSRNYFRRGASRRRMLQSEDRILGEIKSQSYSVQPNED